MQSLIYFFPLHKHSDLDAEEEEGGKEGGKEGDAQALDRLAFLYGIVGGREGGRAGGKAGHQYDYPTLLQLERREREAVRVERVAARGEEWEGGREGGREGRREWFRGERTLKLNIYLFPILTHTNSRLSVYPHIIQTHKQNKMPVEGPALRAQPRPVGKPRRRRRRRRRRRLED